jgi:hypothetical protein
MSPITLSTLQTPLLNLKPLRASTPAGINKPAKTPAASKAAESQQANKKRSLKAEIVEAGVLLVGIFSDAVFFIGYPLILLCQKFKKWLWKR